MKILYDGEHLFDISGPVSLADARQHVQGLIGEDFDPVKIQLVPVNSAEVKSQIRQQINNTAGDTLSLLGTASDGAQLLLFHFATLIKGLHSAQSLEEIRAAAAAFEPVAISFLAKVEADDVKLPFLVKGEAAVMAEIEARATSVSDALNTAHGG